MPCIFCQIAKGDLPASKVHEDEHCLAFMDIHPLGRGHVLVIPKAHVVQSTETDPAVTAHLFKLAHRILVAQRELGWGLEGTHLLLNDGRAANQTVPHMHVHVIPRERGDALRSIGRLALHVTKVFGRATPRGELDRQADRLRQCLQTSTPAEAVAAQV